MWDKTGQSGRELVASSQLHVPNDREPPQDRYLSGGRTWTLLRSGLGGLLVRTLALLVINTDT